MQTYRIQDWVFKDALGRYDIDLGDSNAPCITLNSFGVLPPVVLDYGTDRGARHLREQVADLYGVSAEQIGIAHGAQEALYLIYRTLVKPGDHVITTGPGWQQSWEAPRAIGCSVSIVPYGLGFNFDIAAIEAVIQNNTRAIVINAPCNPTGRMLSVTDRAALVRLVEERGLFLIADEEYLLDLKESLVHQSNNIVSVASLSKIYGAPGLRVGWLAATSAIVRDAMAYKHLTTISNSTLCETLGSLVLERQPHYILQYQGLMQQGLFILREWIQHHAIWVELVEPEGTPFAWVYLKSEETSLDFCRRVLKNSRVLLMPAEVFGEEKGLRITFARESEQLKVGLAGVSACFADTSHSIA
ncbi:aminotransferase class I/II-fold pyridoxal phosphate-dependent enzyme [Glaciimonas immobilis]|uniref:Aminotransferase n=1 Tax=Glaciimonas immobilis TaxID=728004 RepID=A0A840S2B1_9BURK|nr:aminotransferase class I/II-fold pyridoxal phosphate-dependent enzyme [Glaciimonas immobilis]KAF3995936.1 aminotransferase class I/II-fold pyridoxal phosphate-dependent enzyme [Glaciimonas immobilis]MBB5202679.1 aspartate/methionine/tyrosine aminotransferase [Glaciimonas immobilis]